MSKAFTGQDAIDHATADPVPPKGQENAFSAGTGGPCAGWMVFLVLILLVFVIALLSVLLIAS